MPALRGYGFVSCDCSEGVCHRVTDDPLPDIGALSRCPAGELRASWWQAVVSLWEMGEHAPLEGLWTRWGALVAWGVVELRGAIAEARERARREAARE